MDYSIAAIPTVYRGRRYRSRLEARWAAFFDRLQWVHEYEPYDLGLWSPDFLIRGLSGGDFLVEVKPVTERHEQTCDKMLAACRERKANEQIEGIVLLGTSPRLDEAGRLHVGWHLALRSDGVEDILPRWVPVAIGWLRDYWEPRFTADLIYSDGTHWGSVLTGDARRLSEGYLANYAAHTARLWAEASNSAQWLPTGGRGLA